jgi:hypothetical protein
MIVSLVGRTTSGSVNFDSGSGTNPFLIHLEPVMRNHGTFLGEAFDVLSFLGEITQRNEKGKIGVAMTGGANHGASS